MGNKELTLNEYQKAAMATCMPSCENFSYMTLNLMGELGEFTSKIGKLIRKGNLVFGMSREILNWGIMKEEVGGVSSAYNVYIVDEKIVNTTYLECFIAQRMDYFADLIKPASREGQGVDKALLMKKIICIPPSEVMDVFLEKYNSIIHLTEIRNQENSRLSLLRDTLLPRLMSGELEVPE